MINYGNSFRLGITAQRTIWRLFWWVVEFLFLYFLYFYVFSYGKKTWSSTHQIAIPNPFVVQQYFPHTSQFCHTRPGGFQDRAFPLSYTPARVYSCMIRMLCLLLYNVMVNVCGVRKIPPGVLLVFLHEICSCYSWLFALIRILVSLYQI